jgi:hypothetical protein
MNHVYVLGLTTHSGPPLTIHRHRIEFVEVEGVFAALERRRTAPPLSEVELRSQHQIINSIFSRVDDLLPVRFGAWVDANELRDIIAARKASIVEGLALVRGRAQMTIRFHEPPRLDHTPVVRPSTGTDYLRWRRDAAHSLPGESFAVKAAVAEFVIAERTSAGSEHTAASMYHLIARENVPSYRTAVAPFQSATVTVTGPWPPFAFVPEPWP